MAKTVPLEIKAEIRREVEARMEGVDLQIQKIKDDWQELTGEDFDKKPEVQPQLELQAKAEEGYRGNGGEF